MPTLIALLSFQLFLAHGAPAGPPQAILPAFRVAISTEQSEALSQSLEKQLDEVPPPEFTVLAPTLIEKTSPNNIDAYFENSAPRAAAVEAVQPAPVMRKAEKMDTGLSPDAPEALRKIALAVYHRKGGSAALKELNRQLGLIANTLKPEQKKAFAEQLQDPLTIYVALAKSTKSHFLDAQLYFTRMEVLLKSGGRTMTGFIKEKDPKERLAASFLLRAHAYDSLLPYLNRHPAEAGVLVDFLFSDKQPAMTQIHASRIEGLMLQLASSGKASGALDAHLRAALNRPGMTSKATSKRIALYLKINEKLLPLKYQKDIDQAAAVLPPDLLDNPGLLPLTPYALWPKDHWKFVLHFATEDTYKGWRASFLKKGYSDNPSETHSIVKKFGVLTVTLIAKIYDTDAEGFIKGSEIQRFQRDVAADLHDPKIQGVIARTHAQFSIPQLFKRGASPGKLWVDGSCRSAWDMSQQRRDCPTCSFVVNTGTGFGALNNPALLAVVEGLAHRRTWREIGEQWRVQLPATSSRIDGPWTPPFSKALKMLEKQLAPRSSPQPVRD